MSITSLSALDGRYQAAVAPLTDIFSEYGLMRHRVFIEIKWLKFLSGDLALCHVDESAMARIDAIYEKFDPDQSMPFLPIETDGKPFPQVIEARLETFCLQSRRMHQYLADKAAGPA